jgi:Zn-dependent protease with chaperone function
MMTASDADGALIVCTGDFHNSDVSILVNKKLLKSLIPRAVSLVRSLGFPKAIIKVRRGRVVGLMDLEFNAYLKQEGNVSHSSIPLGQIAAQVERWDLPKRLGVVVLKESNEDVTYNGAPLDKVLSLPAGEVKPFAIVEFTVSRHWYGLLTLVLMGCFVVWFLALPFITLFRRKPFIPALTKERLLTLVEVQKKYDRPSKTPIWTRLLIVLALAPLLLQPLLKFAFGDAAHWIPNWVAHRIIWFPLLMPVPFGILFLAKKLKPNRFPETKAPTGPFKYLAIMFIPLILLPLLLVIVRLNPHWLLAIPLTLLKVVIYTIALSPIPVIIVVARKDIKKQTQKLGKGDVDYDIAQDLAQRAGVKLRAVVVIKSIKAVNAFARLTNTIGLTESALEKLTPEERRVVIAHEVGHLKSRHVPLLLFIGLSTIAAWIGMSAFIDSTPFGKANPSIGTVLASPVLMFLVMYFSRAPFQRKAEHIADTFALTSIGSFEEVARTLAKIYLLNQHPHTLKRFHQTLSTHPSLTKRLNHLLDAAKQAGMSVPEGAVERIITETRIDPKEMEQPVDGHGGNASPSPHTTAGNLDPKRPDLIVSTESKTTLS